MWFTVGFAAACAVTAYITVSPWLLAAAVGILCICALLRATVPACKARGLILCIAMGVAVGLLWCRFYDYNNLRVARELDGERFETRLTAVDYSCQSRTSNTVECVWEHEDSEHRVLVYLPQALQVAPGDVLKTELSLRFTGLGGNRSATYHRGEGIVLLGYPGDELTVTDGKCHDLQYFVPKLRHSLLSILDEIFPEDTAAFAKALMLGHTEELSYKTDTELKLSGIRHVVAVSGLHVSFLLAVLFLAVGRRGWLTFCISLPLLLLFGAVIGFTPSVMRACIMQLLLLLAAWMKREYDPLTALSVAVLVILGINPQTVASVAFQLSVGCVAGIILFSGKILQRMEKIRWIGTLKGNAWKYKIKRYILSSIAVSLGATVLTVPLSTMYFGTVSLMAPLTNVICLWLISGLFIGSMVCCAVGAVFLPVAAAAAWVLSWGIRGVLWVAGAVAKIPFGAVYTQDDNIACWVICTYLLLLLYGTVPKMRRKLLLWLIPGLLAAAITVSAVSVRLDDYRLTVLDVGQGQCLLLQADGRTYMVDCGGTSGEETANVAAAQLLSQGICRLDGLLLTHFDDDHINGVPYLLERLAVDHLYLPYHSDDEKVQQILEIYGKHPEYIVGSRSVQWEDCKITVYPGAGNKSSNENSMSILFQKQECAILITGDRDQAGENALLQNDDLPQVDILVVGHHGSDTSTSSGFLSSLQVETAVISVGEDNQYGHPDEIVIQRLEMQGCTIYRTDRDGTVILRG